MYKNSFQITKNTSNNSFSFSEREKPTLLVPSLITGNLDDVKIGNKVVFEDFDGEKLKSCKGLKNFIKTIHPKTNAPVVIVDNHNHVFYFWYEARKNGLIKDGTTLIHIDQHKDTRIPEKMISKEDSQDLNKVFEYTNTVLNVGNYIQPAIEEGLIGDLVSITSELDLKKEYIINNKKSIIINIDLDFWSPEMDYIDYNLKIDITKKWMEKADLITIATSPFFINQELAIKVLKELF